MAVPDGLCEQQSDGHLLDVVRWGGVRAVVTQSHRRTLAVEGSNVGRGQHQYSPVVDVTERRVQKLHRAAVRVQVAIQIGQNLFKA